MSNRLHSIRMEKNACLMSEVRKLCDWFKSTDFIVGKHNRY